MHDVLGDFPAVLGRAKDVLVIVILPELAGATGRLHLTGRVCLQAPNDVAQASARPNERVQVIRHQTECIDDHALIGAKPVQAVHNRPRKGGLCKYWLSPVNAYCDEIRGIRIGVVKLSQPSRSRGIPSI